MTEDDLPNPLPAGKTVIRIVQASLKAPLVDVSVKGGGTIATRLPFAATSAYVPITSGTATLQVRPSGGGTTITMPVTVQGGAAYTLLVLDGPKGLNVELRVDAVSDGPTPRGAVETGAGVIGHTSSPWFVRASWALKAAAVIMLLGTAVLLLRRPKNRHNANA